MLGRHFPQAGDTGKVACLGQPLKLAKSIPTQHVVPLRLHDQQQGGHAMGHQITPTNQRSSYSGRADFRSIASRIVIVFIAAILLGSLTPSVAAAATTRTISGVVTCYNGRAVVGIWVESTGGGSGWANTTTQFAGQANSAYFTRTITTSASSTSVRLDIGCGGTTVSWWSNNRTPFITVQGNRVLNAECKEAAGTGTRCSWPPKGATVTSIAGVPWGECTWGALQEWKKATGYFPATAGNAHNWDNYMPSRGWRISRVPAVRSFVIFEASSSHPTYGHVGWVTGVRHVGSGQFDVTMIEMNYGAGLGFSRTSTFRHKKGTHDYILATL